MTSTTHGYLILSLSLSFSTSTLTSAASSVSASLYKLLLSFSLSPLSPDHYLPTFHLLPLLCPFPNISRSSSLPPHPLKPQFSPGIRLVSGFRIKWGRLVFTAWGCLSSLVMFVNTATTLKGRVRGGEGGNRVKGKIRGIRWEGWGERGEVKRWVEVIRKGGWQGSKVRIRERDEQGWECQGCMGMGEVKTIWVKAWQWR